MQESEVKRNVTKGEMFKMNSKLVHKKSTTHLLVALLFALLATACSKEQNTKKEEMQQTGTYADYIDMGIRIAVEAGDVYSDVARDLFKAKNVMECTSVADMLESVRMGKSDAALLSHGYVKQLEDSGMYPDFEYLWVSEDVYVNEAAPIFHTEELRDKYNKWFQTIKDDGTWQEIVDRWIGVPLPAQEDIPTFELTGENGTLKMCDTGNYPPLIYFDANGEPAGFDVEMMSRFAQYMGMKLEITMMAYEAIVPYVVSGKADMSSCTLTITDEREEGMIMGLPSVITQAVLIVKKSTAETVENANNYTDLFNKTIGVVAGTVFDGISQDALSAKVSYYNDNSAVIEDLRHSRVDGFMMDLSAARLITNSKGNEDLLCIEIPSEIFSIPSGAISNNQDIIDRFNVFLTEIQADKMLNDMEKRWLETADDKNSLIPNIPLSGENGILKVAFAGIMPPFDYFGADGELTGYAVELAMRFAAYEGMDVEFSTVNPDGAINYIAAGKADIFISNLSVTEERKKSVLFSNPIYYDRAGILVLKSNTMSASSTLKTTGSAASDSNGIVDEKISKTSFLDWIKTGIERNLITDNRWKMIVNGLCVTMIISLAAQVFGTVFGCFVCFILMRKNRFVRWLGKFYCGLIHGTPIVVLLMVTYYIIFGNSNISSVLIAIVAFTMVEGAIIAQNLKGAIDTVDIVEIEAARSIGFSTFNAFLTITLPQAVRRVLPSYTNSFVELVKSTAIVGYIAIQDLTRAGDIIRSRTYDAYFPLLFVAVIYLFVTTICVQLFKFAIKKTNNIDTERA